MKKYVFSFLIVLLMMAGVYVFSKNQKIAHDPLPVENVQNPVVMDRGDKDNSEEAILENSDRCNLIAPLDRADERVTKKPFGILITRENSPIQPERFSGYHTGTDFEIFPDELDSEVAVKAICSGEILRKSRVDGYGGVLVQSCQTNSQAVTVLYGHMNLGSINKEAGGSYEKGETIGNLGSDRSIETDGERKHLHLGIHQGTVIDFSGYVGSEKQLSRWLGFPFICL